ncbi:MAG: hypothetical protein ACKVOE_05840 [Rickettsiales bacterium]
MSDHHHHDDKKAKKLAQLVKNKHQQIINTMADQLARGRELEREEDEKRKRMALAKGPSAAEKNPVDAKPWSARMQQVRDRNTGRLHEADGRWNRFAGTEGGGGQGR